MSIDARVRAGGPDGLRRVPVQQRSADKVDRMLVVAARLLEQEGQEAATTSRIAREAGVSIGSLYQFFPDRQAVLRELSVRRLQLFLVRLGELVQSTPGPVAVADLLLDTYLAVLTEQPGYRLLGLGDLVDRSLHADGDDLVARSLALVLDERCEIPLDRLVFRLQLAVEALDPLLHLGFRLDPAGQPEVLTSCREIGRQLLGDTRLT